MPFDQLPKPLILHIVRYLNQHDLNSVSRTCRYLYDFLLIQLYRNDIQNGSFSALRHHCRNGHVEALRKLFMAVPIMDIQDQPRWDVEMSHFVRSPKVTVYGAYEPPPNPMYWAIDNGHIEIVKVLLQNDFRADAILRETQGYTRTAITVAAVRGELNIVKVLKEAGADLNHFRHLTSSILSDIAVRGREGSEHVLVFLLPLVLREILNEGKGLETYFSMTRPALLTAIPEGRMKFIEILLPEVGSLDNFPPGLLLLRAVRARSVELIQLLLRYGADPKITREGVFIATSWAAKLGYTDIVGALVDGGADPDFLDHNNRTPLSYAAEGGHAETVQLLLGYGVDVSLRDSERDWRPLEWALYGGQRQKPDVVRMLQPITEGGWW
jgi:ankyrin repeat protein